MKTPMTLRDRITLRQYEDTYGHSSGRTLISEKSVKCHAYIPSVTLQTQFEATGKKADLAVRLWRRDMSAAFTHAVINDVEYRIISTSASVNDLFIRLVLERGM